MKLLSRAQKKLSAISAWENSMEAAMEAELTKIEVRIYLIINCIPCLFLFWNYSIIRIGPITSIQIEASS